DAIVLDVKCGRGAFMETLEDARALAQLMVAIGKGADRRITALITNMDQPLGHAVGNALEVQEAIATLHGQGPADFQELVESVAAEMLRLGRPEEFPDGASARAAVTQAIRSGAALTKFKAFVQAQGGDVSMVEHPERLPSAPIQAPLYPEQAGCVSRIDAREVGLTVVALGGGRVKKGDPIDHRVGVVCHAKVGDPVAPDRPFCTVHAADEASAQAAAARLRAAYRFAPVDAAVERPAIVLDRIT
ncbi:MAG: pyrimidine-nucleoside phosphorylase, partial [Caldilineae bacterium]